MAKNFPAKITKTVESLKHDAAIRSRWTIQFGLLNVDRLWVFDEIQLMGAGAGE